MKKAGTALVTALVLASGTVAAAAPAHADERCDPKDTRHYKQTSVSWWLIAASGTIENKKAKEISVEVAYERSGTRSTSVSDELGVSVGVVVAELNAGKKHTVDKSVTVTKGTKTTFTAGPKSTVHYKVGIKKRKFLVIKKRLHSNCKETVSYGRVTAADFTHRG